MAEVQENLRDDEVSAAQDSKAAPDQGKAGNKKKKKKSGCGFLLLLILLAMGAAIGLQASGGADLREYVFPVVPRIPYVGETLKEKMGIPDIYAIDAYERRMIELNERDDQLTDRERSLDEREQRINVLSDDLDARGRTLDAEREEVARRIEVLSKDMAARGILPGQPGAAGMAGTAGERAAAGAPQTTSADNAAIEDTIRTFQEMSPKNAAAILEKLDDNLAVTILDGLPQDSRGKLLGRMDAEKAARLTEQLTELQRRRQKQNQA